MNRLYRRFPGVMGGLLLLLLLAGCGWWSNGNATQSTPPSASLSPSQSANPSSTPPPEIAPLPSPHSTLPLDKDMEVERLISSMTLEEKIGQMLLVGIKGTTISPAAQKMIIEQHIGGIILYKSNLTDTNDSIALINALKETNARHDTPLFISIDHEGGKVNRLPNDFIAITNAASVGHTHNEAIAKEMGSLLARELHVLGMNVNFAPVLDINSNPKNPIGDRAFGASPELVTKMGIAVMNGIRKEGIISVVKHFPGHGDTIVDSHKDLPIVNKTIEQLEQLEWIPFRAAIAEDVDIIMIAHMLFPLIDPDAPSSFSKVMIDEQLRGTLGYDGVVISDDMTMGAIEKNYGITEASVRSIRAGSDIVLLAHGYDIAKDVYDKLVAAVKAGDITEDRIDQSVYRILALKHKYSLSDDPLPSPPQLDSLNEAIQLWLSKLP